jgi:hypothetical protein
MGRFLRSHRRRFRPFCGGVALAAYLAVAVGFPVPAANRPEHDPSPCPPDSCACDPADRAAHRCCCCQPVPTPQPVAEVPEPPACPHCAAESAQTESPAADRPASAWRWQGGIVTLRCRGLATVWVGTGAVVPPPVPLTWSPTWPLADRVASTDDNLPSLVSSPPDPPPRAAEVFL